MNKLTALSEAAKAADAFCNKCGYMGPDEPTHQGCNYMAKRTAVVLADDILELCALLEKAEEALDGCLARLYGELYPNHPETLEVEEALAAIKQWKGQT